VDFIWNIQGKIRENEHICPLTVYIKKKLSQCFYKLVTVTWNPNSVQSFMAFPIKR
jgi:hypothetical protein